MAACLVRVGMVVEWVVRKVGCVVEKEGRMGVVLCRWKRVMSGTLWGVLEGWPSE